MFRLNEKTTSGGVYTIAEMSANHAGKLENAMAIVRKAKEIGADCLKIQTYTADTITINCDNEFFRIYGGLWDGYKLYDLYNEAYMPWDWQPAIKAECDKAGIDFLSTPFDRTAVDFLEDIGCEAYKIASFELVDIPLIEYAAAKGKPMLISCGMGSIDEIQDAVDACRRAGNERIVLLKCCSEYPANWPDMHLANIPDMISRFGVKVGLSDHSMGSLAAVVGVSMGACVVEKHMCLSRDIPNPDSAFSMEPEEFGAMIRDVQAAAQIRGNVSYGANASEKSNLQFRRSLFAVRDIRRGEHFSEENVRSIRPSDGMKPKFLHQLVENTAGCDIAFGAPIKKDMLTASKPFKSARLLFRPLSIDDAEQIVAWRNDAETQRSLRACRPISVKEHLDWFPQYQNTLDRYDYVVEHKATQQPIGTVTLSRKNGDVWEIGYMIANKDFRQKGFGTEAVAAAIEQAKSAFSARSIVAEIRKENLPSIRLVERLGFGITDESQEFCVYRKLC